MNAIFDWLARMVTSWKCWIVVEPWNVGVRIRLGKTGVPLAPGLHPRIPFLDEITIVNTRQRISSVPSVTLQTDRANVTRSISAIVGFSVRDPLAAMLKYSYPELYICSFVQALISKNFTPEQCEERAMTEFWDGGLDVHFVRFVEDVEVRSYRFLNGGGGGYYGGNSVASMGGVSHY